MLVHPQVPPPVPESSPPDSLCRGQILKITSSHTFSKAGQLQRLLHFLGTRSLDPMADSPSEKEIAESVLNRRNFDPQTDSLVRKEMSRLREKLAKYYSLEGGGDPVVITAPSGYSLGFALAEPSSLTHRKPCWLVLPFRSHSDVAEQILEDVLLGLGESGTLDLVAPATALGYRNRLGDLRELAAECRADFVVEGSLRRPGSQLEVAVWLVDGKTGIALRSGRIIKSGPAEAVAALVPWLLG